MAKRKKKEEEGGGATWLITFSDMMTLLLTFFVLLVSMAIPDSRRKLIVLTSVSGQFGEGHGNLNPATQKDTKRVVDPGPMEMDTDDLSPLKDLLWEDDKEDLNFQENKYVQVFSISEDVLFQPGTTQLSRRGVVLLNRILPWVMRIKHPLLLAGHTSALRDEAGVDYEVSFTRDEELSPTWNLSFMRVMSVYSYLKSRGIDTEHMMVEAFGNYHPRWSDNTPKGRKKNRRVDIVLDKRNMEWINKLEELTREAPEKQKQFDFKDFKFDLSVREGGDKVSATDGSTPSGV
ncbi:OmpA/MotB family protein [Halodesulfovibrio spirochaetisodalis]|uniref:Flagellar motor protein MotB n=1 Tax=Halodesulfovibrio spirochaetisodalis TaxID=1560234 RepID=A0A1B7XH75_9BACT|nr:flagellar motor protein MotB [Halodesulfovibrio spirochaetisodalis]OBQ54848.1 flagellar motor protein MotB [Halodesulfovibrio spirochaetisodalis]